MIKCYYNFYVATFQHRETLAKHVTYTVIVKFRILKNSKGNLPSEDLVLIFRGSCSQMFF